MQSSVEFLEKGLLLFLLLFLLILHTPKQHRAPGPFAEAPAQAGIWIDPLYGYRGTQCRKECEGIGPIEAV